MASQCASRVSLSSDNCPDDKCGLCLGEECPGKDLQYCQNCKEYICKACAMLHENMPGMRAHVIVGATDVHKLTRTPNLSQGRHKCLNHPGKRLEAYCENHRNLCCSICIVRNHSKCTNIVDLSEAAARLSSGSRRERAVSEVKQIRRNLKTTRKSRYSDKSRLDKEKTDAVEAVKDFRTRLNDKLDAMEKEFLKNLATRTDHTVSSVTVDMQACDVMLQDLKAIETDLKQCGTNDEVDVFVNVEKANIQCKEARRMRSNVEERVNTGIVKFAIEDDLTDVLSSLKEFGQFHEIEHSSTRKEKVTIGKTHQEMNVAPLGQYDMTAKSDAGKVNIQGIAFLWNGNVVVGDNGNSCLKIVNEDFKLVDVVKVPSGIIGFCMINDGDMCITSNKKLEFIRLDKSKSTFKAINVFKDCYGVASNGYEICITCGDGRSAEVRFYSTDGRLVRTVQEHTNGERMFAQPRQVTFSEDGSRIHVSDAKNGLISLDRAGHVMWRSNLSELRGSSSVCASMGGHVYVCSDKTNKVLEVSADGKTSKVVVNGQHHGLVAPVAVAYSPTSKRLAVAQGNAAAGKILVLELK